MPETWISFNGLTLCSHRILESFLPGKELTDTMLYHLFASGVFESIEVKRPWDAEPQRYTRTQMQNYVHEKDRLEILKLRAELADLKGKMDQGCRP